ncbi:lipid II:glycine glycyltransferase FemX [Pseudonocardia acaciae]|uniref:lipid II:glycine glycyltransferase FemX n=1 Tax=Pseudonocardia acaciae TaxID=551276 RepID=UPI00048F9FB7|nr:GNAT family N-acetyltransferase [Pseudonocardia acaciae]
MQVHPAAEPAEADRPAGASASGGLARAGASAADRARAKRLLERLTVTVEPEPDQRRLAAWDRLVSGAVNSDVAQLSAWATIRRRAGYEPLYLLATSEDTLLGGAALLRRRLRGLGWIGYLPYGPVLAEDLGGLRASVRQELADALTKVARSHVALFVQPPDGGDDMTLDLLHRGFRFSQAGIAPAATMRVDLTQSEAELRSRLSRRLRTWTRQWPQRGVKVRVGDERDVPLLARLAASTASYQGFTPFPEDYLEATYAGLAGEGHAVLLIGELDGTPVAAELLTGSGGVLKSRITGLDRSSEQAGKLNVASAMIWEAISWGKANGYRWYDFGGLRPESVGALRAAGPSDPDGLAGPDQFKTKFGGEVHTYPPAVELIKSRTIRLGYDLARRGEGGRRLLSMVRETLRGGR